MPPAFFFTGSFSASSLLRLSLCRIASLTRIGCASGSCAPAAFAVVLAAVLTPSLIFSRFSAAAFILLLLNLSQVLQIF
jgi:hypothetical protein